MSEDMSLEDVAKVLNEHGHKLNKRRPRTWGECDSCSDCVSNGFFHYDMFEGRAIAREYKRLDGNPSDVGPATKKVLDDMAAGFKDAVAHGAEHIRIAYGIETMTAIIAENEARS